MVRLLLANVAARWHEYLTRQPQQFVELARVNRENRVDSHNQQETA